MRATFLRLFVVVLSLFSVVAVAGEAPRIAIIIDDIGYRLAAGQRAIDLPGPVSYAVLPGAPRAALLAQRAHAEGKEVLLHLPLQASVNDPLLDPVSMTLDMNRQQFRSAFATALTAVPHAVGVNNHRGSLSTQHVGHMTWLMQEIQARPDLFFVDSFTTHESVALQVASEVGVSSAKRDVFLDPDLRPETVSREFERVKRLARENGSAIAIGHPHASTLALLERELPLLQADGFELVTISELIR